MKKTQERRLSAVISDNVPVIRETFMDDNRCTYQMIPKEVNTGYPYPYKKQFYEKMRMKKNDFPLGSP